MIDVVDSATRSRMMSGIKSKNTKPELLIRKSLHALGLRYRLHSREIIGHPDMVLQKWRVLIFVHGCFWHWHGCRLSKLPSTRTEFWQSKLRGNRERDEKIIKQLINSGWRCVIIWECALRGKSGKKNLENIAVELASWIRQSKQTVWEIKG